jgi:CSLREA domain-containing protein
VLLVAPASAGAREFVVNTTQDIAGQNCDDGVCSLREAVQLAGSADTITVPQGEYFLSLGELVLQGDTINGAGARSTIINGNGSFRVLRIIGAATGAPPPSTVTGVTIRGGNGFAGTSGPNGVGGGVYVQSASLQLGSSHVVANTAGATGGGIGIQGNHSVVLNRSTVAGNTVRGRTVEGGGIGVTGESAGIALINSTLTGNSAISDAGNPAEGGGIFTGLSPRLLLVQSTIAGNVAQVGGGVFMDGPDDPGFASQMNNTLIVGNTPTACNQALTGVTTHHNLVQDSTCALGGAADIQGVNAPLLDLTNNGGLTDTRALPAGSPAINAGGSCQTTDQRGLARPPAACDIGAFEYVAPTLTVTTSVVNDNGGTATAVTYRVTRGGADVAGSPASASASYTLEPGSFNVSGALAGYTVSFGGDCSPAGDVTLGENQSRTCTVVANDNAISGSQLPPPVIREKVNMIPARGTIRVKRPGAKRFRKLAVNGAQLPVGTTVDALNGRVTIVAASDAQGGTDTAVFYGGIFKIGQTKGKKPTTILSLTEKLSCPKAGAASIAAKRKKKRRLWGDGEGKFRTKGKHSAATVVGTKWLVEDRCTSTLTRVVRGRVSVRDFAKKKTVIVRSGKKYTARAG